MIAVRNAEMLGRFARLGKLGYDGELADAFFAWAGSENLEERVDGIEQVDPVVLEELRSQT